MDIEGIGEADEQVEERAVVNGFRDLGIGPAHVTQALDLLVRDAVGIPGQRLNEFQQQPVLGREVGCREVAFTERGGNLRVLLTLQLQEPCMTAQSIVAAVERRDI